MTKYLKRSIIALLAMTLLGCHSARPSFNQTWVPAWWQVQTGMTKQQVYAIMGKPLRETEQLAQWKGPQVKMGWPSNWPATSYWHQFEAYFDANGRVANIRDYDMSDHQ